MKSPLNASQTIAVAAVAVALLGGAYALGRKDNAAAPPPELVASADVAPATPPAPVPARVEPRPEAVKQVEKAAPQMCNECARVNSVRVEEREGQGSGLGAVGGAVLGGILGNQIGGGTGKKIATVGGAVAGGYAGNEVEKRSKSSRVWIVNLTNKDGSTQRHEQASDPQLQSGDIVVFRDGRLERQR